MPPQSEGMKLYVLIGFDNKAKKSVLLTLCLINNENYETICAILKYLINNHKFNPKLVAMDIARGVIKGFKDTFKDIKIIFAFIILFPQ